MKIGYSVRKQCHEDPETEMYTSQQKGSCWMSFGRILYLLKSIVSKICWLSKHELAIWKVVLEISLTARLHFCGPT